MRSPSGIGINAAGDVFYSEQQGNWNCGGGVHHIRQGAFHGHQASFASAGLPDAPFVKPAKPVERVPIPEVERLMPIYQPPAVWLPYRKVGMSATDLVLDNTGGKFGPFDGQFFVGEFTMSGINRVFLEKVGGEYQGACFNFMEGFECGVLRLEFGDDGSLFVGETNRGWNSFGTRSYGLQRVLWDGKQPFEMLKMEALPHGFRCTFTKPITRAAAEAAQWQMRSYTYEYHAEYGGPDIDEKNLAVRLAASRPMVLWRARGRRFARRLHPRAQHHRPRRRRGRRARAHCGALHAQQNPHAPMNRRHFLALAATSAFAAEPATPPLRVAIAGHTGKGNFGHGVDAFGRSCRACKSSAFPIPMRRAAPSRSRFIRAWKASPITARCSPR